MPNVTLQLSTNITTIDSIIRTYEAFVKTSPDFTDPFDAAQFIFEASDDPTFTGVWSLIHDFGFPWKPNQLRKVTLDPFTLPFVRVRVIVPPATGTWSEINLTYNTSQDITGTFTLPPNSVVGVSGTATVVGTVTTIPTGTQSVVVLGTLEANLANSSVTINGTSTVTGSVVNTPSGITPVSGTVTVVPSGIQDVSGTVSAVQSGGWTVFTVPSGVQGVTGTVTSVQSATDVVTGTVTSVPTGTQVVSGNVTVNGSVAATQSGSWTVNSIPSGTQTIAPSGTQSVTVVGTSIVVLATATVALSGTSAVAGTVTNIPSGTATTAVVGTSTIVASIPTVGLPVYRNINLSNVGQVIKSTGGILYGWDLTNLDNTTIFFKFYDKATAPTSTDIPKLTLPLFTKARTSLLTLPHGLSFTNGIGIRVTSGLADNDNGAPAINTQIVNIWFN